MTTATSTTVLPAWLQATDTALPMLPAAALKIIELASQDDVTILALVEAVSRDPVLATRVLSAANSGVFSAYTSASTLTEAAMRLGSKGIRSVVITVSFASRMHDPKVYGTQGARLHEHAVGVASLALSLAAESNADPEACFIAGLLHDIGKLVILKRAHDARRKAGRAIPDAEVAAAVADHHTSIGVATLERWRLPSGLIETVACHHDYLPAEEQPVEAAVVYAANQLAHRYGFGCDADGRDLLADPVAGYLAIDSARMARIDAEAKPRFEKTRAALG
jgi:putative nucleotidyltransferase with HDIG domain